jgi:hypothetical protein
LEKVAWHQMLNRFSFFNTYFAFLDTENYLADGLFIKHQVRIYFGDEFVKPDFPYRIIFCHVRKWDKERFHAAMSELPNKMLLCGNVDYLDACTHVRERILNIKNERGDSCGADGAAEQAR